MADVQASYTLNIKQVLDALNAVDKTNDKVWKNAEKSANRAIKGIIADHKRLTSLTSKLDKDLAGNAGGFANIGKSAQASGVQIGAVAGIVTALTNEFINLGKQAIGALVGIAQEGVNTALEFDTLRSRLLGIFDGSKPAAEEAFNFIQERSKELGIDLGEVAGAFLPKLESLEQFERVAKIATALARSDPEQGAIGARIALVEALSGTFTSLNRRFEIPKDDIKEIKEAFDTEGMNGFILKLEEVLGRSGKSFDDLKTTAQASIDRVNISFEQLKGALGIPIVAELKEQFDSLFDVLEGREDDLLLIADTFGRVAANVVELIGSGLTDFLTNLDSEQVVHIGETIFTITEDIKLLSELLLGVEFPSSFLDGVDAAATKVHELLDTTAKLVAMQQAESARTKAETQKAFDIQIETGIPFLTSDDQRAQVAAAGQEAYNKVILEAVGAMDEATAASEENADATDKRREAIEKAKDTSTADADALLGQARAAEEAAEAAEELAGAQAKVDEAMSEAKQDRDRKFEDIDIAFERKKLDIAKEFADQRLDAARESLRKIADLRRHEGQAEIQAATDLDREEADIASKFAREKIDLEEDQRQKRVDIEKNFRQTIEDIESKSAFDLDEAERNRDAVSFLRIVRQQGQEVSQARTDRQREIDDLKVTGDLRKAELKTQQDRELADAQLANRRKIEDLRASLDIAIEDQRIAFNRQITDINFNEQRKNDEAKLARDRDREDAQLAYDRKLADLAVSLADELAIIAAGNAAIEEEARRHADEMAAAAASSHHTPSTTGGAAAGFGANPGTIGGGPRPWRPTGTTGMPFPGMAGGGPLNAFRPAIVGENGPELFTPSIPGVIIPNERLMMNSGAAGAGGTNNFNNQRTVSVNQSMLDPSHQSAIMRAIARQEALNLINELN